MVNDEDHPLWSGRVVCNLQMFIIDLPDHEHSTVSLNMSAKRSLVPRSRILGLGTRPYIPKIFLKYSHYNIPKI